MTTITWVRGDKPLPLQVNMDLTGCTVNVTIGDYDDSTAPVDTLTGSPTSPTSGAFTVDVSTYAEGRYQIQAHVFQGSTLIATFPNDLTRTLLNIGHLQA